MYGHDRHVPYFTSERFLATLPSSRLHLHDHIEFDRETGKCVLKGSWRHWTNGPKAKGTSSWRPSKTHKIISPLPRQRLRNLPCYLCTEVFCRWGRVSSCPRMGEAGLPTWFLLFPAHLIHRWFQCSWLTIRPHETNQTLTSTSCKTVGMCPHPVLPTFPL